METQTGTIYIATNLLNGKQYVGQTTKSLSYRMKTHKRHKSILSSAIKKYGSENFKWISFSCAEEDLDWMETFLIKEFNTLVPAGYNLESGGNKNKHHHEITTQKISLNVKRYWSDSAKREDQSRKIRQYWSDLEIREIHGRKLKGLNAGEKNGMYGKGFLQLGPNNPNFGNIGEKSIVARPVVLISPEGIQHRLPCYTVFCAQNDLNAAHICEVLQGKRKHHKGWTGRYEECL